MKSGAIENLSAQGILSFLPQKVKDEMLQRIFIFDCLESTNETAKKMAADGAKHGTVIIADHQTAGKGCHGKAFFSPPGHGIYMSFILHPHLSGSENPTQITASAAVYVCEAIEAVSGKLPKIKRINDILLDRKKICGILTESVINAESHKMTYIILGIGINFSTPLSDFPEELQGIAGSLFETQPSQVTRNRLIAEIISNIMYPDETPSEDEMMLRYNQRLIEP